MSLSVLRFCWFCIHSLFFVFFIYLFIYSSSLFLHFFYPLINALPLLKATTTFNAWCSLMEVVDFLASYTDFGFCYGYARNFPVSPLGYRLILVHIVWIFVTLREVVALNFLYFPFYFIYLFYFHHWWTFWTHHLLSLVLWWRFASSLLVMIGVLFVVVAILEPTIVVGTNVAYFVHIDFLFANT